MKKLLLPFTLLLLLASCGDGERTAEIPVLDVTKSYPAKTIVLQDIAEVEYVALETGDGFLVDYASVYYMDDEILILSNNTGDIMTFDRRTGKGLSSFNRKGRGPGEYVGIGSIAVDRQNNEMFVTVNMFSSSDSTVPIYVYDLQGNRIRTLQFRGLGMLSQFHIYDEKQLLMRNSDLSESAPFKLMSKTDTIFTSLPFAFEGRDNLSVSQILENGRRMGISRRIDILTKTGDGYVISETGVDTLYRWNKKSGELTPLLTRTPSFHSMEYPIAAYYQAENRDYLFLCTVERKYDFEANEGFKSVNLIYDKKEGQFYEGTILNGDFVNERKVTLTGNLGLPVGTIVEPIQPHQLLDLREEGKLQGKAAEIAASGIKEDDNAVLMIATFK
jgi:hypothetical protein